VTTDLRELLRETRYFLDSYSLEGDEKAGELLKRINAALSESAPEPVAEVEVTGSTQPSTEITWLIPLHRFKGKHLLYAAPPPPSPSDARDAARYRWLRTHANDGNRWRTIDQPERFDDHVDAAIEREEVAKP